MTRLFTMPDYYPGFRCKGGGCRHNCCLGWRVTVSMQDYFRLLGTDCSPDLRRRLDVSLRVLDRDASPERYAEIGHDWEGRCRLLDERGYCLLLAECGEEALSATCRYHPRAIRTGYADMCAVSCSCEALTAQLLTRGEPLTLVTAPADFALPLPPAALTGESAGRAAAVRDMLIACLQDRSLSLPDRLARLTRACMLLDAAADRGDALSPAQAAGDALAAPPDAPALPDPIALLNGLLGDRPATEALCRTVTARAAAGAPEAALSRLYACLPQADAFFEHLLVNHCLVMGYPLPDQPRLTDAALELTALFLTLRCALAYAAPDTPDTDALVDVCTDCFRVYEHGSFAQRAVPLMRDLTGL